jgi:hypothetical protein
MELGRMAALVTHSQKGVVPLDARAIRHKELEGDVRYYERLLREVDEQEAAAADAATL